MPSPRIEIEFAEFQQSMPAKFEYWHRFIHARIPRPTGPLVASQWDGLTQSLSNLRDECIPDIRRAFAEKKKPEDLAEEFDHLILTLDTFQGGLSELLIIGISRKQVVLDEPLQEQLSAFFSDLRRYRFRFGWTLRQEIKAEQKPNKALEPTPTAVTSPATQAPRQP